MPETAVKPITVREGPALAECSFKDGEHSYFFEEGGEWCFLRTPTSFTVSGPAVPCVIHCHGNGGFVKKDAADWLDDPWKREFVDEILKRGIAVAESHACGNHWGTPNAHAAVAALADALLASANVDAAKLGIWGGGLGGALVWGAATGPLLGKLRAAAMQQATLSCELPNLQLHSDALPRCMPLSDVLSDCGFCLCCCSHCADESVIRAGKFKDQLLIAFGMPPDSPDDLAVSTLSCNDPVHRTRLLRAHYGDSGVAKLLPEALLFHGVEDENMLYEGNAVALADELKACGAAHTLAPQEGVGHATYAMGIDAARPIAEFFQRCFSSPKL